MGYKTILVHLDTSSHNSARIDAAIHLAQQQDAHLVGLDTVPPSELPSFVMAELTPTILEVQRAAAAREVAQTRAEFNRQTAAAGLHKAEWRSATGDPVESMTLHARYADLVVISQTDPSGDGRLPADFPERLVLASGRPVLMLPFAGSVPATGKRILIAWKPGREATRAVTDAIPLLQKADTVHVMAINPRPGEHGTVPGADIALYLSRHGVRVEVKTNYSAEIDIGNELLSRATDLGADLIVMGGYGHSRLQEFVLGGATRTILQSMTVPVLMAH